MRNHNVHGKCRHGRWFGPAWVWFPAWIGLRLCDCCGCSRLSVPSTPPGLCPSTRCTSDFAPSVLLSVTGLDSSATPKPRPPARCQKTCPPSSSAHLSSAFLPPPQPSSPQLSSAHLSLGPSAGRPHSVSPLALNLQPNPSRCLQLVWSARACGPRAARPAAGRMGRAERCSQPVRLSPLAPRSGPKLNSSTCEPPVIDL